MPCLVNRNGRPHVRQQNRRALRQQRASERLSWWETLDESQRKAVMLENRDRYVQRKRATP